MNNNVKPRLPYDPATAGSRGVTDKTRRENFSVMALMYALGITAAVMITLYLIGGNNHAWRALWPMSLGPLLVLPWYRWIAKRYNVVPPKIWPLVLFVFAALYYLAALIISATYSSWRWHTFMTSLGLLGLLLQAVPLVAYVAVIHRLLRGGRPGWLMLMFGISLIGMFMLASDASYNLYHRM